MEKISTPAEREYMYKEKAKEGHYAADVFAVRCFDNRFWKTFKGFIKHQKMGDIDPESVAGGAKIFSNPEKEGDKDFMLRELEKSIQLHKTNRVMLFTHSDCGAYGGLARFKNDEDEELVFHTKEHEKAREAIYSRFPDIPVESYFIYKHGVIRL